MAVPSGVGDRLGDDSEHVEAGIGIEFAPIHIADLDAETEALSKIVRVDQERIAQADATRARQLGDRLARDTERTTCGHGDGMALAD